MFLYHFPSAFNSSPVLPPCLRRRSHNPSQAAEQFRGTILVWFECAISQSLLLGLTGHNQSNGKGESYPVSGHSNPNELTGKGSSGFSLCVFPTLAFNRLLYSCSVIGLLACKGSYGFCETHPENIMQRHVQTSDLFIKKLMRRQCDLIVKRSPVPPNSKVKLFEWRRVSPHNLPLAVFPHPDICEANFSAKGLTIFVCPCLMVIPITNREVLAIHAQVKGHNT